MKTNRLTRLEKWILLCFIYHTLRNVWFISGSKGSSYVTMHWPINPDIEKGAE